MNQERNEVPAPHIRILLRLANGAYHTAKRGIIKIVAGSQGTPHYGFRFFPPLELYTPRHQKLRENRNFHVR